MYRYKILGDNVLLLHVFKQSFSRKQDSNSCFNRSCGMFGLIRCMTSATPHSPTCDITSFSLQNKCNLKIMFFSLFFSQCKVGGTQKTRHLMGGYIVAHGHHQHLAANFNLKKEFIFKLLHNSSYGNVIERPK